MSREARSADIADSGKIRVTFQVSRDAANYLQQLSDSRWPGLGELGIVDVQISDNNSVNGTASNSAQWTTSTYGSGTGSSASVDEHIAATKTPRTRRKGYKRRKKDKVVDDKDQVITDNCSANISSTAVSDSYLPDVVDHTSFDVNSFLRSEKINFASLPLPEKQNVQRSPTSAGQSGTGYRFDLFANVSSPAYGGVQTHSSLDTINYSHNALPAVSTDSSSSVRLSAMSEVSPFLVNLLQNESYAHSEIHRQVRSVDLPPPSTPFVPKRRKSRKRVSANIVSPGELKFLSSAGAGLIPEGAPNFSPCFNGSVNSIQLGLMPQQTEKSLKYCADAGTTNNYNIDFLDKNKSWSKEAFPDKSKNVNVPGMKSSAYEGNYGVSGVPYSSSQSTSSSEVPHLSRDGVSKESICSAEVSAKSLTSPGIVKMSSYPWQPVSSTVNTQCSTSAGQQHLYSSVPANWSLARSESNPAMSSVLHDTRQSSVIQQKFELNPNQMVPSAVSSGVGASEKNKSPLESNTKCDIEPAITSHSTVDELKSNSMVTSVLAASIRGVSSSVSDCMPLTSTGSVVSTSQSDNAGSSSMPDDRHASALSTGRYQHNGLCLEDGIEHQFAKFSVTRDYNARFVPNGAHRMPVAADSVGYEGSCAVTYVESIRQLGAGGLQSLEMSGVIQNCSVNNEFESRKKAGNEVTNHLQLNSKHINGMFASSMEKNIHEQHSVDEHFSSMSVKCKPCTGSEKDSSIADGGSGKLYANALSEGVNGLVVNGSIKSMEIIDLSEPRIGLRRQTGGAVCDMQECEDNGSKTERRMSCDSMADDILLVTGSNQPMNDSFLKCHLDSRLTLVTSNKL